MDNNTNKIVSVQNHQKKLFNCNTVCSSSKRPSFVNFCKNNGEKSCDEENMEIYNKFTKQGR